MAKRMFFTSDPHFAHDNIISWERHRFKTIEEHDTFLVALYKKWAKTLREEDEFYVLGDWGDTRFLPVMDNFNCKTIFVYGNHDKREDYDLFAEWFDEVHLYPFYISNRTIVSHHPVAVYEDQLNIHGHCHRSKLDSDNHVCVSVHVRNYNSLTSNELAGALSRIPKLNRRFLWEPFADQYVFTQDCDEAIYDKNGRIDLSASRVVQAIKKKDGKLHDIVDKS